MTRHIWPGASAFSKVCARPGSPKNDRRPALSGARRLPAQRRLRGGEAGDWNAKGGARDVVESRLFTEGDRGRIAAVFAADAELEVGPGRATALGGDGDEFADAFSVQGHERISLEQPLDGVKAKERRRVVARYAERGLGEVVGAEREELGALRYFAGSQRRARQFDHGADLIGCFHARFLGDGFGHGDDDRLDEVKFRPRES